MVLPYEIRANTIFFAKSEVFDLNPFAVELHSHHLRLSFQREN